MEKCKKWTLFCAILIVLGAGQIHAVLSEEIAPGIWKLRFGEPEGFTPCAFREAPIRLAALATLPAPTDLPFDLTEIHGLVKSARTVVYVPCDEPGEQIYGFGLDSGAFEQKGLRKFLSVSAQSLGKTGLSHGPVPFYVSTRGYGVYVDTARVPFVHVARLSPAGSVTHKKAESMKTSVKDLYAARQAVGRTEVVFDLPGATGVDVYVFAGPGMKTAVQRYNLFSGGGAVPPLWGLGLKYRNYTRGDKNTVMTVAKSLRQFGIPCDMIGLEPGWQTAAYSCSLVWSDERFQGHQAFVDELVRMGFRVNLWEHAYIHPTSPLFDPLKDKSGDFLVWGGLVVDFADPRAFDTFSEYHGEAFIDHGISGFKADECDRQFIDDVTPFNYPYCTTFPSGIDGDQMTQLYGTLYQRSIQSAFRQRNLRTWGDVRATSALAAPLPFALYSDSYGFNEYLRQLVNASFTGLLWSPEVREAGSLDELLNRTALSSFAHQMCFNPWFIPNPLWSQYERKKNEQNDLLPMEEQTRIAQKFTTIINQRMSLIPYLYAAFYQYYLQGTPPLRAIVMDFPNDPKTRSMDDAFMFGDSLLVAPLKGTDPERKVYLPQGTDWFDLHTGQKYVGGQAVTKTLSPGQTPVFVKDNSLVPWARPLQYVADDTVFEMTVKVFGDAPRAFTLYSDDGLTYDFQKGQFSTVTLEWDGQSGHTKRAGPFPDKRYQISAWLKVGTGD